MAGRKPKPTKLKILEGNPGKQRLPKGEPMPDTEMPEAPEHLDKYAREEWGPPSARTACAWHSV